MFKVKANTVIQIQTPKSDRSFYWSGWLPYTTKETKWYDTHEVYDIVSVRNGREMPEWIRHNIAEFNKVVISRDNKFALVNPQDIEFVD